MRASMTKEQAMHDLPRVSFLVVMNTVLVMMLILLLGGCVSTPAQNRYRHGDFIMNIGSAGTIVEPMADATPRADVASPAIPSRG
jgi:hypothetical protein